MTEEAPQPKVEVPGVYFDKAFLEGNFLIPENAILRTELKAKLTSFLSTDAVNLAGNEKTKAKLLTHIAAIDAYNAGTPKEKEIERDGMESRKERIAALSAELIESNEVFPFPGINPEAYAKLKADIEGDKEMSLYDISSPSIDELIERFKNEGMRVTFGDTPEAGNVFIVPAGSNNYSQPSRPLGVSNMVMQSDNLSPRHLQASGIKEKLEELVLLRIQVRSFAARD